MSLFAHGLGSALKSPTGPGILAVNESEEEFCARAILDNVPKGIVLVDAEYLVVVDVHATSA